MFKNIVFVVVCAMALLVGCEEDVPVSEAVWVPLACDIEEVTVWTVTDTSDPVRIREITTTRTDTVAVIHNDAASVVVRTLQDQASPCASTPDNCVVRRDTRLSPEDVYVYYVAGTRTVTGIDAVSTRVACATEHSSVVHTYVPGQPSVVTNVPPTRQVFAEGGDVLITR